MAEELPKGVSEIDYEFAQQERLEKSVLMKT